MTKLTTLAIARIQHAISSIHCQQPDDITQKHHALPEEHIRLLEKTKILIPILASHQKIAQSSSSNLWHPDLVLHNIFSIENPTIIEGIIDWQFCVTAPLFLQCSMPVFLERPTDTIHQQLAILKKDLQQDGSTMRCILSWTIQMFTLLYRPIGDFGCPLPFALCKQWSKNYVVPLRRSLIWIFNDWSLLELSGECPFSFTENELERHEEESKKYQE